MYYLFSQNSSTRISCKDELDLKLNYNVTLKEVVTFKTSISFAAEAVENEKGNYKKKNCFRWCSLEN